MMQYLSASQTTASKIAKNLDQKSVKWVQTKNKQFNLHEARIDCSVVVLDYISFIQVYTINCQLSVDMIKYLLQTFSGF